jgi:hypothetical protein
MMIRVHAGNRFTGQNTLFDACRVLFVFGLNTQLAGIRSLSEFSRGGGNSLIYR